MTNEMIANIIDMARSSSVWNESPCYVMSNGTTLRCIFDRAARELYEGIGYWVAMTFEDGHRVEA